MLKKAFIYFLIFSLSLHSFSRLGILAYFYMNQPFISNYLCENRDKPLLHCNGKCYLAKKIKIAEEEERKHTSSLLKAQEINLFSNQLIVFEFSRVANAIISKWDQFYLLKKTIGNFQSVFHPPQP